jgi:cellulose synthase/poly-beta-1,6-N-acetylglucosamine synthase-like glycosyltransferase
MKNIFMGINAVAAFIFALYVLGGVTWVYFPFFVFVSLFTAYNLVIFSYSLKRYKSPIKTALQGYPRVAVLYMTYNDMNEKSLESIFGLDYTNYEVLIVDDSTSPETRKRLDEIALKHGAKVIRRSERKGFKAGAINNALKYTDAEYVSICDADELLPKDFIQESLKYFTTTDIAFVQASHYAWNKHGNWKKYMGYGIDLHWMTYQEYRNEHSIVNFLGHGALIRSEAIRNVNGFPEIVSEDIALTVELYNHGYRGVFAKDVSVGEAFPETYNAFKRRHKKWSMGSVDFLKHYWKKAFFSRQLTWAQKEDLLINSLSLPMTAYLVIFTAMTVFIALKLNYLLGILAATSILAPSLIFAKLKDVKEIFIAFGINAIAYMSLFPTSLLYVFKGIFAPNFVVTGQNSIRLPKDILFDVMVGLVLVLISHGINPMGVVAVFTPVFYSIWK